jgi:hypothetical protein
MVFILAVAIPALLWLVITMGADDDDPAFELIDIDLRVEALRKSIEKKAGVDVSELRLLGGRWQGFTARGWVDASEMLRPRAE